MANTKTAHSVMFNHLKEMYEKEYVSKETLRGWVRLHAVKESKGISESEYEEITGDKYVA